MDEETLKGIADEDLEQAVVDYICDRIGDDWRSEYETVVAMTKGFQAIWTTWCVEGEVRNGGFN